MFTVRIEQKFPDDSIKTRVLTCAQYQVEEHKGRKIMSLYDQPGAMEGQVASTTLVCDDEQRAFVMNDQAATVDIVPPLPKRR